MVCCLRTKCLFLYDLGKLGTPPWLVLIHSFNSDNIVHVSLLGKQVNYKGEREISEGQSLCFLVLLEC